MVRSPWALACFVSLQLACFTGADAQGLPCDNDRQCGLDQSCIDGFCGGPGAGTSASSSDASSASTSLGTSLGESSTSSTTDTTVAAASSSESTSSGSGSTGNEPLCPPPPELARCTLREPLLDRDMFSAVVVASDRAAEIPVRRPSSVVTGLFDGDDRPDLALQDFANYRLHLFMNDEVEGWTEFGDAPMTENEPFDLAHADLDCDGNTEFMIVTQQSPLVVRTFTGSGFEGQRTVSGAAFNYSLAVGDVIEDPDHYPDVITSQGSASPSVLLLHNVGGELDGVGIVESEVNEPWDTTIVQTADGPLVLVPEGRNGDDGLSADRVAVFRPVLVDGDAALLEPMDLALPATFDSPWAVAAGNFLGDEGLEVAVGERHVDGNDENTDTVGTVRLFAYLGQGGDEVWEDLGEVSTRVGLVSLAVADLDCDGYDDLFVGHNGASTVMNDDGVALALFGATQLEGIEAVELDGEGPIAAGSRQAVADFDLDGAVEVAVADFGGTVPGGRVVIFGLDP